MKRFVAEGLPTAIALDWHARLKTPASQQLVLETKLRLWFAPAVDKTLRVFSSSRCFAVFTPMEGVVRVYDRHDVSTILTKYSPKRRRMVGQAIAATLPSNYSLYMI